MTGELGRRPRSTHTGGFGVRENERQPGFPPRLPRLAVMPAKSASASARFPATRANIAGGQALRYRTFAPRLLMGFNVPQ